MILKSRAVVMLGQRRTEVREIEAEHALEPDGAVLRVLANGICGSDWDVYSGAYTGPVGKPIPFPLVLGHEPVGRIEAIGASAAAAWGVTEGDRVVVESQVRCGSCRACIAGRPERCSGVETYSFIALDESPGLWGGMAEFMVLRPHSSVFKVPDELSDADATLFNPWGNAFHWTLGVGRVEAGDRVLVLGAGQRGLACAVAAEQAGAAEVIVTGLSRDAHKLQLATEFGASETVDVQEQDTVDAVRELTAGLGVDVVIDTVPEAGGPILDAIEVLRPGGHLVLAGTRSEPVPVPLGLFRDKRLRMSGATATTAQSVGNALRVLASGRYPLDRLHTHTFGLDGAERAIRIMGNDIPGEDPIHVLVTPFP